MQRVSLQSRPLDFVVRLRALIPEPLAEVLIGAVGEDAHHQWVLDRGLLSDP